MIKDNFTQLHFVLSWVLKVENYLISLTVNFWEIERIPSLLVEIQLDVGDLMPSICFVVVKFDTHFLWVTMRKIIR